MLERGAGQPLYSEGDPASTLIGVLSGRVRIARSGPVRDMVLDFGKAGDVLALPELVENREHSASAVTIRPTTLLAVNRSAFQEWLGCSPQNPLAVSLELARLVRHRSFAQTLLPLGVIERICGILLQEHGWLEPMERERLTAPFRCSLTQTEIAGMTGTTAESVCRALKALAQCGAVRQQGRELLILDPVKLLARYSQ